MFMVSWSHMAAHDQYSKPLTLLPSFLRSLLNPRRPGSIDPSIDDMYMPVTALPSPAPTEEHLISRIYYIEAHQIQHLQKLASSNGCKRTKLESFSAFLWKLVAKCGTSGTRGTSTNAHNPKSLGYKMGIMVDGRKRFSDQEDIGLNNKGLEAAMDVNMMESYFGNVLSIPFGRKTVDELVENPLDWVAGEVHNFIQGAVTKEHFLGLIDWVEAHRPVPGLAKIYGICSEDGPAFMVSSGQSFPVAKVDFEWGRPFFESYQYPWGGHAGYVMPMPTATGNSDWVVYMHLSKRQLEFIEKEATQVFRPLTFHCLDSLSI
ncbi:hypothetical protein FNV43_RR24550 [Rhamnella rubrinervis]|uniref:Transferase n=1 Tax=Rhamnella rubrinervis TaxID=2594499 RepID=A0A8K0DQR5_9ROSA|nr:hypothetical protein FNV43_RR24550 [Rhamnella rubrinervis]